MTFLLFLLHYKQFFLSFENVSPFILKMQDKMFFINDHLLLNHTSYWRQRLIFKIRLCWDIKLFLLHTLRKESHNFISNPLDLFTVLVCIIHKYEQAMATDS